MEAERKACAARRRNPVRLQDRRDPCRDRGPRPETVIAWKEHPTRTHPYGQPPVTIEEVFKVGDIVKADAGWRRAMKRRGLSNKEIELVQVDPFSAGYFDRAVERGRRLVSAVSYWRRTSRTTATRTRSRAWSRWST